MASSGAQSLGLRLQDRLLLAVDREIIISRVTFLRPPLDDQNSACTESGLCCQLHATQSAVGRDEARFSHLERQSWPVHYFLMLGSTALSKLLFPTMKPCTAHSNSQCSPLRASLGSHLRCHQ